MYLTAPRPNRFVLSEFEVTDDHSLSLLTILVLMPQREHQYVEATADGVTFADTPYGPLEYSLQVIPCDGEEFGPNEVAYIITQSLYGFGSYQSVYDIVGGQLSSGIVLGSRRTTEGPAFRIGSTFHQLETEDYGRASK